MKNVPLWNVFLRKTVVYKIQLFIVYLDKCTINDTIKKNEVEKCNKKGREI